MKNTIYLSSISQMHDTFGFGAVNHPLITVLKLAELNKHTSNLDSQQMSEFMSTKFVSGMYVISMKDGIKGKMGYGRSHYDFEDGVMTFVAPGQVLTFGEISYTDESKAWSIIFHPDLIRKSNLGKCIQEYSFFDYEVNEALFLSDKEKHTLLELAYKIEEEISANIDKHTQGLIVSNLELILNYCTRYYDRQFYTRTNLNKDVVSQFEQIIKHYFQTDKQQELGIPTVKYLASEMNLSANYLSDLLKKETDRSALEHIQSFVIERAKNILLSSNEPVSQVAYGLGFEYSQHFSKMFKQKTGMTPGEFRTLN